jgi:hypothetical protein
MARTKTTMINLVAAEDAGVVVLVEIPEVAHVTEIVMMIANPANLSPMNLSPMNETRMIQRKNQNGRNVAGEDHGQAEMTETTGTIAIAK